MAIDSGHFARAAAREQPASWIPDSEALFIPAAEIVVRDASAADAAGIAAIGKVAVPETYKDLIPDTSVVAAIVEQSYAIDALRDCLARCARVADAHFLVAEQAERIVGFLHYDCEGPEPELHRIYVDPARKRQGIGSGLMRELHRRLAPGSSYVLMVVAANRPAVSFYEHLGLTEAARLDGVTYMHERMGVEFAPATPEVPALILHFTKPR